MVAELVWLEQAEEDLESVFDYIFAENPPAANAYIEAIVAACDRLRRFPRSGRAFDKRYRMLVVRNHLVFYRYEKSSFEVVIAAIVDGRRDVAALLRSLGDLEK